MDRITDSGSVGCGSIPHGATVNPPVAEATAPRGMPTRFACRVRFSPFRISLRKIPGPLTRLVTPRQARNPPVAGATAPRGMPTSFACRDGVIYTNGRASGSIRDAREERSAA